MLMGEDGAGEGQRVGVDCLRLNDHTEAKEESRRPRHGAPGVAGVLPWRGSASRSDEKRRVRL